MIAGTATTGTASFETAKARSGGCDYGVITLLPEGHAAPARICTAAFRDFASPPRRPRRNVRAVRRLFSLRVATWHHCHRGGREHADLCKHACPGPAGVTVGEYTPLEVNRPWPATAARISTGAADGDRLRACRGFPIESRRNPMTPRPRWRCHCHLHSARIRNLYENSS